MEQELILFVKQKKCEVEEKISKVHVDYDELIDKLTKERAEKLYALGEDLDALNHLLARYGVEDEEPIAEEEKEEAEQVQVYNNVIS